MTKHRIKSSSAVVLLALLCGLSTGLTAARAEEKAQAKAADDGADQITRGKRLFISYGCGWCHEDAGRKAGKGPQLMNTQRDDAFILTRIATGSQGKMPAFGTALNAEDFDALLAYIRSLKPDATQ